MSNSQDPFSARRFAVQSNRATGGVIHRGRPLEYDAATRRVWYGEAEQPFDPKRMAYDEYVGSVVGPITVKDVMEAAGAWGRSSPSKGLQQRFPVDGHG